MHLRGYPKYFVKGDKRRPVYYTAEAAELLSLGWKMEEELVSVKAPVSKKNESIEAAAKVDEKAEKIEVEIVEDTEKAQVSSTETKELPSFEFMTRVELLRYAQDRGVDLPNNALKAELISACKRLD